ncbi:MAG: thymidylate synthase [Bacteroidota bacterium]
MEPLFIKNTNLSEAWTEVLNTLVSNSGKEISPLLLTLTDFVESSDVRELLDADLASHDLPSIQTVSETIFPQSLYQFCGWDRHELYDQYMRNYQRIRRIDSSNHKGTYFQRMIAYQNAGQPINQLEMIITSILSTTNKRRSKLQASIFDPEQDHTNGPYQRFPCLQHVTFYKSETGGLVLNSFYAIQFFYRRAYGNWLGLINLGKFIAQETGLEFERLNCFIGVEQLDNLGKTSAKDLLDRINLSSIL